ncbi:hypothetical protein LQ948_04535 [Jiella sp. MQZ9-1]|uniref:Uncharacterized protein n=1 Tax=Jiella flava TaxID=2816857 RepID=A0A939FW22_9HYPH|nr:hypothetical protein [Jiella flava]MBO0661831.1 hypothetical protein [Jiella flava]MCD2470471.1 hypothetical protein [Jiella flava]
MRFTVTVRHRAVQASFRRFVEAALSRRLRMVGSATLRSLPSTSNLTETPEGRALLADPFAESASSGEDRRPDDKVAKKLKPWR